MLRDAVHSARLKLILAGMAVVAPVAPAIAAPVGGFYARPAHFDPQDPITRAYFREHVRPGQTVTDQVLVTNGGAGTIQLRVYPVDGLTGVTSGAVFSGSGQVLRKAGRWVTTGVRLVTLTPSSQRLVGFVVQVPENAVPGDHLAGLAFENAYRPRSGGQFSITQIIRVVVGIEIEVPGPASPQVRLSGVSLQPLSGTQIPAVIVRLGDTGRKLCHPGLTVSVAGTSGGPRVVHRQLDTILPGDTIPFPLLWPRPLHAGSYTIAARATNCGPPAYLRGVARLDTTLRGTSSAPGLPLQASAEKTGGTPWLLIVGVGVGGLLLGALLVVALGRRRRDPPGRTPASAGPVAPPGNRPTASGEHDLV